MKKQLVTIFTLLALGGTQLTYALDKEVLQEALQGTTAPETEEAKWFFNINIYFYLYF